ncbi:MAG: hypothetical protein IJF59_02830 [Clostridia bacterium]|nr:hypothetical protein [Clostridia bacterium]
MKPAARKWTAAALSAAGLTAAAAAAWRRQFEKEVSRWRIDTSDASALPLSLNSAQEGAFDHE